MKSEEFLEVWSLKNLSTNLQGWSVNFEIWEKKNQKLNLENFKMWTKIFMYVKGASKTLK